MAAATVHPMVMDPTAAATTDLAAAAAATRTDLAAAAAATSMVTNHLSACFTKPFLKPLVGGPPLSFAFFSPRPLEPMQASSFLSNGSRSIQATIFSWDLANE